MLTTLAHAEGSLDEKHDPGFYWARGGALAGAAGLTIGTMAIANPTCPEATSKEWLAWDNAVRGHLSTLASTATDVTLLTAVILPLGVGASHGVDTAYANASLFYAEVLGANVLLNTAVKYSVPRLRPYNYCVPPATAYVEGQRTDAYLSFYSGHASTAFAAAIGGSYLFTAAHPDAAVNPWLWGIESAMAVATAIGRVRAGKHFYSDIAIGALVGSALGIGIPLLEGVRHSPSATEMAFAGGGALAGGVVAVVVPFREDTLVARAVGAPLRLHAAPTVTRLATGISVTGSF